MNLEQLKAIAWLRWRLTVNQFMRGGAMNAAVGIVLAAFVGVGAIAFAVSGFLVGWLALGKASALALVGVWDGVLVAFLLFWMIGLVVEIQRSETIDISRLLHLPITASQVFVFNYLASHFTPVLLLFVPGMLGLCLGLAVSAGPLFLLTIPVVLAFVFMLTAWTYCLRGWLAALMVNKRRRRAVVVWITIIFVVVAQLPNFVVNSSWFRAKTRPAKPNAGATGSTADQYAENVLKLHLMFPPGWITYTAATLKKGQAAPAAGLCAISALIGILGLKRGYTLTIRFYRGVESAPRKRQRVSAAEPGAKARSGPLMVERSLPWLSDDTAALALASFRGLLRAPELKMAFITPLVFGLLFGSLGVSRVRTIVPGFAGLVAGTAVALLASFSFAPTMSNLFGLDRSGFRGLVLLPTPRHRLLFGKNLAFFPFVALTALVMLLIAAVVLRMSPADLLTGIFQVPIAFLLFCLVCNMPAILAPYRFSPGTLQAKKPKPVVMLSNFVVFLTMPLVGLPLAIAPGLQILFSLLGFSPWIAVSVPAAVAVLVGVALVYRYVVPLQARLLQKRELFILKEVTEETE